MYQHEFMTFNIPTHMHRCVCDLYVPAYTSYSFLLRGPKSNDTPVAMSTPSTKILILNTSG